MNIFFELPQNVSYNDLTGKNFASYDYLSDKPFSSLYSEKYSELIRRSNRVWCETPDGVKFVKHRYGNPDHIKVNMKEFFWIKLKSIAV